MGKGKEVAVRQVIAAEQSRASYCYILTLGLGDPSSNPGKGKVKLS